MHQTSSPARRAGLALSMILAAALPAAGVLVSPVQARAEMRAVDAARIADLAKAMGLGPLLAVMREEGLNNGRDLDRDILRGQGGVPFQAEIAGINDPSAAQGRIEAALLAALADQPGVLAAAEAFYATDLGRKVATLEVEGRRALLDPEVRAAAGEVWRGMGRAGLPRVEVLNRLVRETDLVAMNLAIQTHNSLAFYQGLREGGGLPDPLPDSEVRADLAQREGQMRLVIRDWLFPYLALCYEPLSDAELDSYAAFLTSSEGKALNMAMTGALDSYFAGIAHETGLAVSRRMAGQDI